MSWYQGWVTPRKLFTKFERNLWRNDIHIFLGTESPTVVYEAQI